MAITWDLTMATGVRSVDDQHKELFRQVAILGDAMSQGKGRDEIKKILDFVGAYVVKHFADEEKAMEEYDCPVASANKAAHNALLARFKDLRTRFDATGSGPSLVLETYETLSKWLVQHIKEIDTRLLESLQRPSRAVSSS